MRLPVTAARPPDRAKTRTLKERVFLPSARLALSSSRMAFSTLPKGEWTTRQATAKQITPATARRGRKRRGVSKDIPQISGGGMPGIPPCPWVIPRAVIMNSKTTIWNPTVKTMRYSSLTRREGRARSAPTTAERTNPTAMPTRKLYPKWMLIRAAE